MQQKNLNWIRAEMARQCPVPERHSTVPLSLGARNEADLVARTPPGNANRHGTRVRWGTIHADGAERTRTADLLVANQTLSQLSYDP